MDSLLFLLLGAGLVLMSLGISYLALSGVPDCPECGGETVAVRSFRARLVRQRLGRRWCLRCGWEGFTRLRRGRDGGWRIEVENADESSRKDSF